MTIKDIYFILKKLFFNAHSSAHQRKQFFFVFPAGQLFHLQILFIFIQNFIFFLSNSQLRSMEQNQAIRSQSSFRVNQWVSSTPEDAAQSYFKKYGDRKSKQFTVQSGGNQSVNRYHTEFSQITNVVDTGFKRMKYNQMETLNELRQQYEILRNLPIQEDMMHETHYKKHSQESIKQSVSSESKKSRKRHRDSYGKQMQMLGLEKRQLEMVIGNSMKKIEDLLNKEAQYKKIIHQLQLKLDSRGSESRLDGTVRTLKRNEIELNEKIENLKKQIQRLKQVNRQLMQKNSSFQNEISVKDQQIRRLKEDRRRFQDQIRSEKDRNSQLQIEYKKLKVQYELLEKDKNNQINRLNRSIIQSKNQTQNYLYKIKTLEEQIKTKESMIQSLRQEIERIRNRPPQKTTKIIEKRKNNEEQMNMLQTLIGHLREQSTNQNRASMDLITSILQNKENKKGSPPPTPKNNDQGLLLQLENIKEELYQLRSKKEDNGSRVEYNNVSEYLTKISNLENDLADSELQNLKLKDDNTNLRSSYEQMKQDLETIHKEYLQLKSRLSASENSSFFISENMKTQFRQKQMSYEEQIRNLMKQLDEALFTADRERKDKDHTLNLLKTENLSAIRLLQEQLGKLQRQKNQLRGELEKMKAFYEAKLRQKNQILEKMSKQKNILIQTQEKTLLTCKNANEKQMGELLRKLHEMAEINDRYMKLSAQCSEYEREVHELRHYIRKFKVLNDNVDHLWMVKEAQYGNLHMILDSIRVD